MHAYETDGAELRWPDVGRLLDVDLWLPFSLSFVFFEVFGVWVRRRCWQSVPDESKRYRLCNVTTCLLHSVISGVWALSLLLARPDVMFLDPMRWYCYGSMLLPLFSMGYFAYDAVDMLWHERSRWVAELFAHHVASVFVFGTAVMARKFIPYAHWALLMEISSVFLHARSLLLLSGEAKQRPLLFLLVRVVNVVAFVVFRFGVQAWQIHWAHTHRDQMHGLFMFIGVPGGLFFLAINLVLFARLLVADCSAPRSSTAVAVVACSARRPADDNNNQSRGAKCGGSARKRAGYSNALLG